MFLSPIGIMYEPTLHFINLSMIAVVSLSSIIGIMKSILILCLCTLRCHEKRHLQTNVSLKRRMPDQVENRTWGHISDYVNHSLYFEVSTYYRIVIIKYKHVISRIFFNFFLFWVYFVNVFSLITSRWCHP